MKLRVAEARTPHGRVRWRECGAGEPVVLLPGLGLTGRFYDRNAPAFAAAGFRFIVPDMPSFGGTRGALTGQGIEHGVVFAREFIDLLQLARVHWIGHSVGAQTALAVATAAPDRAMSLCLAGPTGSHARFLRRTLHQALGLTREAVHAGVRVIAAVARDYVRTSPLAYIGTWLRAAVDEPFAHAPFVSCPALLVAGTDDPVATRAFVERLAAEIPRARIAWVEGGGHALPRGCADGFNAAIISFLRTVDGGAANDKMNG